MHATVQQKNKTLRVIKGSVPNGEGKRKRGRRRLQLRAARRDELTRHVEPMQAATHVLVCSNARRDVRELSSRSDCSSIAPSRSVRKDGSVGSPSRRPSTSSRLLRRLAVGGAGGGEQVDHDARTAVSHRELERDHGHRSGVGANRWRGGVGREFYNQTKM